MIHINHHHWQDPTGCLCASALSSNLKAWHRGVSGLPWPGLGRSRYDRGEFRLDCVINDSGAMIHRGSGTCGPRAAAKTERIWRLAIHVSGIVQRGATRFMRIYHSDSYGFVQSSVDRVFAHIDDHTRLSSHMNKPSWKMGGGHMETRFDAGRGQEVGSRIGLSGSVFGVALSVEEVVTERDPPKRKVWETSGAPRLLVISRYRMGFELSPCGNGSILRVFIEYALPESAPARWLGRLFGAYYARWCTQTMVDDAVLRFASHA